MCQKPSVQVLTFRAFALLFLRHWYYTTALWLSTTQGWQGFCLLLTEANIPDFLDIRCAWQGKGLEESLLSQGTSPGRAVVLDFSSPT